MARGAQDSRRKRDEYALSCYDAGLSRAAQPRTTVRSKREWLVSTTARRGSGAPGDRVSS
jgi:hypothetical protein